MVHITGTLVKSIIDSYHTNHSILKTAKATGASTVKVRKVLITEGLWESDTSIKIGALLKQGLTTEEIAKTLWMSIKNVQAYMPYERGLYGGDELSQEAVRADKYRNRMKKAASMQVVKKKKGENISERMSGLKEGKIMEFRGNHHKEPDVLRLHLELNLKYTNEEELQILKKYGSMKQAISRDILVPSDITLHALNYAILRMFGWQNGHLHSFRLPENLFKELTENLFCTWSKMAGVYFRFPTENYDDIYWDDDYEEGKSFKSWMKKKYTGPYLYKGYSEHYIVNQMEVERMFATYNEITVHEFVLNVKQQPEPYQVKLKKATIDQVTHAFADIMCHELIERLPLAEVLCVKNKTLCDFSKIKKHLDSELSQIDVDEAIEEYEKKRFTSKKQEQDFLGRYNIPVLPVTEQLIYNYDYGDGWEVLISCENAYNQEETGTWRDMNGEEITAVPANTLDEIMAKHRPTCIEKDGIELVDDVGGIGGFCRMLRTIYETDVNDEEAMEERVGMLEWADMMGWTGRRIRPKHTL